MGTNIQRAAAAIGAGQAFCVPDDTTVCDRVALLDQLATNGATDPGVLDVARQVVARAQALAARLREELRDDPQALAAVSRQSWYARLLALEALRAAQSIAYVPDGGERDCYKAPARTLQVGGECKALTVFFCALCRALGLHAEPIWITQTGQLINHVTSRCWLGNQWAWAEPSVRGAMLGESPYEAVARTGANDVVTAPRDNPPAPATTDVASMSPAGQVAMFGGGGHGGGGGDDRGGGGHGGGWGGGGWGGGGFGRGGFGGFPFAWGGWNTLWGGWPASWWCRYYPYLCAPYNQLLASPLQFGFYPTLYNPHAQPVLR